MACQESRLPIGKFNLRQEQSNGDTTRISVLVYMAIQYGMYKTSTATGDLPKPLRAMRTVNQDFLRQRDDFKIDCRDGCTIQTKVEGSLQKQTLYWREKRA